MRTGAHKAHGETVEAKPPEAAHLQMIYRMSVRSSDERYADSPLECGITHVRIGENGWGAATRAKDGCHKAPNTVNEVRRTLNNNIKTILNAKRKV